MSDLLDEWAEAFRDQYHEQIETKCKRQIKKRTTDLIRLVKNKNIDVGDFADEVMFLIARISHLKAILQSSLAGDTKCYKDYLKTLIKQSYTVRDDNPFYIENFCKKYNKTRDVRLKRLKGAFLKNLSKY